MRLTREQEQDRWDKIRHLALAQGYVLCQVSARRYQVVQVSASGGHFRMGFDGRYRTHLDGEIVFNGTYRASLDFIAQHTPPVPDELIDR